MKKIVLVFTLLLNLFAKDENTIVIAGPIASVSHPILYMIEQNALKDIGKKIEFKLWNNPDELRALILKKEEKVTKIKEKTRRMYIARNI